VEEEWTGTLSVVQLKVSLKSLNARGEWPFQPIHYGLTSLLSWVKSTATPASTLPTVREINMLELSGWVVDGRMEICLAKQVAKLGGILTFSGKAVHDSFRLTFKAP
jgi:hypothetical protein